MAPRDYLTKLQTYYGGHKVSHEAILSTTSAALLSVVFTLLYVVPFYITAKTRPSPAINRDAPSVIKARIQTVSATVAFSTLGTFYVLFVSGNLPLSTALHYLGLYPIDLISIVKSLILTSILFAAPLYESLYIDQSLKPLESLPAAIQYHLTSWQGYRNYVAGPLTEELLFRSAIVTLHLLAHVSAQRATFLTPLYFGIAHVHHFYEFHLTHPHTPLIPALLRSVFQFAYTTVFGWYAAFIFVRTGNLYAVFLVHALCNWIGLPRLWGRIRFNEDANVSDVVVRGKEDTDAITPGGSRGGTETPLIYSIIYYALLICGVCGFCLGLFPFTSGADALATYV